MGTQIDQEIPELPIPPYKNVDSGATFVTKAETFRQALKDVFQPAMNYVINKINIISNEVSANTIIAENSANIATAAANYKGNWVAGYNTIGYSVGMSVKFTDGFNYISNINNNLVSPVSKTNTTEWGWIEKYENLNEYDGKTTPADADLLPLSDSTTSFSLKKVTLSSLKANIVSLQFDKPDNKIPLFIKVSPSSIKIPSGFKITVGANSFKLASDYTLTLASNLVGSTKTAGTDYYVYAKADGTFYISASDAITTDRLIGGFHYGLVGESEAPTGNKTEAWMVEQRGIWSHSCWDLKFRPSSNVRGKNFAHGIWADIYLADEDIAIRGYSSPWKSVGVKAKIAGGTTDYGRAIPKIPLAFGGNGTLTYGKFTWFQAAEIAASLKCFLLDYGKFPSLAYGVLEGVSSSTNGYETTAGAIEHYPNLTSRYLEQATGVQYIWGADLANYPTDTTWAWKANTDGRGQIYSTDNSPTAVILGGYRSDGAKAGSRASAWDSYVWLSGWSIGCRFACDHLELV